MAARTPSGTQVFLVTSKAELVAVARVLLSAQELPYVEDSCVIASTIRIIMDKDLYPSGIAFFGSSGLQMV